MTDSTIQEARASVRQDVARVHELTSTDVGRWNSFVRGHPEATFFHLAEWKSVLEQSLGHRGHFLCAEVGDTIEGVLPLGQMRSRLFGNSLISTPFCVYGGILATSARAREALGQAALDTATRLGVDYLELRNRTPQNPAWHRRELYVTFRKALDPEPEQNMLAIPRKQRAMVRKGIKAGLVGEIDLDTERFFRIYSESVRNLGTPVFPRRYFRALKETFGDACEILTVVRAGEAVASVMSFYFRDEVLPYYGGGTAASRDCAGNDFLYWELMRLGAERGVRVFDYGRSKVDSGSYRFKTHWGFEPVPLHYECHPVRKATIPEVNPLNSRYRLLIAGWKRLPLPVSRVLGPLLARNLG